jgi:hypothetical protein
MTPQLGGHTALPGAYDPLDVQLDRLGTPSEPVDAAHVSARTRSRGWSSSVQATVFLLVGVILGRQGFGILSESTLSLLDPVVPVALAVVGVLVAFEIGATPWIHSRVVAAASTQGIVAALVVTAGTLMLAPLLIDDALPPWILALALGVCASTSSVWSNGDALTRASVAQVLDVDAVLPIILGGLVIAAAEHQGAVETILNTGQVFGLALTVATAGWLLLARTVSDTEQRIFSAATLLLLGGVADYLGVSALMAGLVAGAFWHIAGGAARESIRRDLTHLQHPLVALILVVAGARIDVTVGIIALAVAYVLLRAVGKLAGSIATVVVDPALSRDAAPHVLSPGILGVAFALNMARALGTDAIVLLSIAVLGTIGAQLLAGAAPPEELA